MKEALHRCENILQMKSSTIMPTIINIFHTITVLASRYSSCEEDHKAYVKHKQPTILLTVPVKRHLDLDEHVKVVE